MTETKNKIEELIAAIRRHLGNIELSLKLRLPTAYRISLIEIALTTSLRRIEKIWNLKT